MPAYPSRPAVFSLIAILLFLFSYVPANAGTLWVSPSPQGSLGESRFEFELPPDMRGLVSAKVMLVSGYPASISFEAHVAGETLKIDGQATLPENSIRELDVSALMLERSAYEKVSLVLQIDGDTPKVLALRLEYRDSDEIAPQRAATNTLVLDDLKFKVGGDVLITGDLQVDGQIDGACSVDACSGGVTTLSCGATEVEIPCEHAATDTILISSEGPGNISVTCPVIHPFLMGGACEKGGGGSLGFGPSTSISTTTYSCVDGSAGNDVRVVAICSL